MKEIKEPTLKQPKTVQVKLLVPYAIIAIMVIGFMGVVGGWTLRSETENATRAEATKLVESLSVKSKE